MPQPPPPTHPPLPPPPPSPKIKIFPGPILNNWIGYLGTWTKTALSYPAAQSAVFSNFLMLSSLYTSHRILNMLLVFEKLIFVIFSDVYPLVPLMK